MNNDSRRTFPLYQAVHFESNGNWSTLILSVIMSATGKCGSLVVIYTTESVVTLYRSPVQQLLPGRETLSKYFRKEHLISCFNRGNVISLHVKSGGRSLFGNGGICWRGQGRPPTVPSSSLQSLTTVPKQNTKLHSDLVGSPYVTVSKVHAHIIVFRLTNAVHGMTNAATGRDKSRTMMKSEPDKICCISLGDGGTYTFPNQGK